MSTRPYKGPWQLEAAISEIERGSGGHFDPRVVNSFLTLYREGKFLDLIAKAVAPAPPLPTFD